MAVGCSINMLASVSEAVLRRDREYLDTRDQMRTTYSNAYKDSLVKVLGHTPFRSRYALFIREVRARVSDESSVIDSTPAERTSE